MDEHKLYLFATGFFFTWVLVYKEHKKSFIYDDVLLTHLILICYM